MGADHVRNSLTPTGIVFRVLEQRALAVGDEKGRIYSWPLDVQELMRRACVSVTRELTPDEREYYFGASLQTRATCDGIGETGEEGPGPS